MLGAVHALHSNIQWCISVENLFHESPTISEEDCFVIAGKYFQLWRRIVWQLWRLYSYLSKDTFRDTLDVKTFSESYETIVFWKRSLRFLFKKWKLHFPFKKWKFHFPFKTWSHLFLRRDGVIWFWKRFISSEYKECCGLSRMISTNTAGIAMQTINSRVIRCMIIDIFLSSYDSTRFKK